MEYLRYYDEIVSRRQSCRDFTDTVVDAASVEEIKAYNEVVPKHFLRFLPSSFLRWRCGGFPWK